MQLEILGLILFVVLINLFTGSYKSSNLYCGIVGFSGKKAYNPALIKFLLYWNSIERGKDATGIYTPNSGIIKDIKVAGDFISDEDIISQVKKDTYLIGHVRAKTVGVNSKDNAHPWEFNNIVGLHNGSLKDYYSLANQYSYPSSDWSVDSQVLLKAVDLNFETNELFKVLGEYHGAAALLMYHKSRNTIFACHDAERTLFYGYINKTEMYISSIEKPLQAIGCTNIKAFDINKVYEIQGGEIINTISYTPAKDSPTEVKAAGAMDMVKTFDKGIQYCTFKEDIYTGISYSPLSSGMLIGYNLRYRGNISTYATGTEVHTGTFIKGKPYMCVAASIVSPGIKAVFEDEFGSEHELPMNWFDHENFIPVKDKFVTLLTDIVFTKTNKQAARKGDVVKVTRHIYGNETTVGVLNLLTNERISIDIEHVIPSEAYEVSCLMQMIDLLNTQESNPSCELPLLLNDPKNIEIITEDGLEDDYEDEDEYIDSDVVKNLLKILESKLENIENKNDCSEDTTSDLNDLKAFIVNCKNITEIEAIVEVNS